jgi:hypothetical protein
MDVGFGMSLRAEATYRVAALLLYDHSFFLPRKRCQFLDAASTIFIFLFIP